MPAKKKSVRPRAVARLPTIHKQLDEAVHTIEALHALAPEIDALTREVLGAFRRGRRVYLFGNGGSAADAQHIAAELVGRYVRRRRHPLPAVAFTTNTSTLTALGNDFGLEECFARQVKAFVDEGDVVIAISTSGDSENVLRAVAQARRRGARLIALTGRSGGKLARRVDLCLRVPCTITARIQEAHQAIGHILCRFVDEEWKT